MVDERVASGAPVGLVVSLLVGGVLAVALIGGAVFLASRKMLGGVARVHRFTEEFRADQEIRDEAESSDDGFHMTEAIELSEDLVLALVAARAGDGEQIATRFATAGVTPRDATDWITSVRSVFPEPPRERFFFVRKTMEGRAHETPTEAAVYAIIRVDGAAGSAIVRLVPVGLSGNAVVKWHVADVEVEAK